MKGCGADSRLGEWPRVFIRAPYTYPTPTTSPAHRTMGECVLLQERSQHSMPATMVARQKRQRSVPPFASPKQRITVRWSRGQCNVRECVQVCACVREFVCMRARALVTWAR